MKNALWLVMITLILSSCYSPSSQNLVQPVLSPLQTKYIKDSTQYDRAFINGLSNYNEPLQLIDNYIVTGTDTTYFPEDIPLNNTIVFKATRDHKKYLLTVSRTSLTNVSYTFKLMDEKEKLMISKSGTAVLGSLFFLASEVDEDTQTGESYGSYEYWDKTNECWFALRIGHGNTPDGKQRAMVNYGCEDKNKQALKLEECPTLWAEYKNSDR